MVKAAIALICLVAAVAADARPVEEYDWIEVRTENFVIHSLLSERQTLMTARHIELLRNSIPEGILPWNQDKPVPDTIFLLKGSSQIRDLGYDDETWYVSDHEQGEYILIGADTYSFDAVDSAYLRFLVGTKSSREHVVWYEEGLVGLFRDSKITDGKFVFGRFAVPTGGAPHGKQKAIDWLLSDMDHSTLSYRRYRSVYTAALALTRMLVQDNFTQGTFGEQLNAYAGMRDRGASSIEAFESAFRMPVANLGQELSDFGVERCCRSFEYPLDSLLPDFQYELRPLRRAEVALGLGRVAARLGGREEARRLFERAARNESTKTAALEGLEEL